MDKSNLDLLVVAANDRRRAGFEFRGGQKRIISADDLDDEKREMLFNDPVLNVRVVELEEIAEDLTEAERSYAIAEYCASLPYERRNDPKAPTVAEVKEVVGFKPSGKEIKAAWEVVDKE